MLMLTTGCGESTDDAERREPAAVSETPEPSLPTMSSPPAPPTSPTDVFSKVRVVGSVVISEDSLCVDLVDDNGVTWTLLGPETDRLLDGQRVTVTGRSRPELPECTGAPLTVQKLTVLS
jgi:hypothetical protein